MAPAHTSVMSFSTGGWDPGCLLPSLAGMEETPSAQQKGGFPGALGRRLERGSSSPFQSHRGVTQAKRPSSPHFPGPPANTPFCNSKQGRAAGSSFQDICSVPLIPWLGHTKGRNRNTPFSSTKSKCLSSSRPVKVSLTLGQRWSMAQGHLEVQEEWSGW